MLFMVIEQFRARDPVPIYARVHERGRSLPDGLKYVDSWVEGQLSSMFPADGMRRCCGVSKIDPGMA